MKGTSITVVGNVITPINRRNLDGGRPVANFRVACNERRIDRATGEWGDGDTFYIGVTCWRELAQHVAATFGIGDPIIVRGRIYTSTYDGKEGRRTVQEIDADAVGPDLARCTVSNLQRIRRGDGPGRPVSPADGLATDGGVEAPAPDVDALDPFAASLEEPVDVSGFREIHTDGDLDVRAGAVPVGGH